MALDHSPEFKVVIVQVVCVVEIKSESAWALTNIISGNTCHAKFHASEASGSGVIVVLLCYAHRKHLRSYPDGQLTTLFLGRLRPPKRLTSTSCTYFPSN